MLIHKVIKGFVILKNRDDKYDPPTVVSETMVFCRRIISQNPIS